MQWVEKLMGDRSRRTHAATFPQDRYYCLLDELPVHLVPRAARDILHVDARAQSAEFVLNPECVFAFGEELPDQVNCDREVLSGFALQGTIAWVRDSLGRIWPYWLGPKLESLVRSLKANEPVPASFPPREHALLAGAGILVSRVSRAADPAQLAYERAGLEFREKGYVVLPNLIHPFHVAALRRYFRNRIRNGAISLGDRQSARRYAVHNEPVARFFHHQIAPVLSAVAGEELKPSYVYSASYLSGSELKKHTDREQCEFSITFCLDYSPEPSLASPWPIRLQTKQGSVAVHQALGDGLAYRGTRLPHYRGVLGENQTSTSIFFHYVSVNFNGPLN